MVLGTPYLHLHEMEALTSFGGSTHQPATDGGTRERIEVAGCQDKNLPTSSAMDIFQEPRYKGLVNSVSGKPYGVTVVRTHIRLTAITTWGQRGGTRVEVVAVLYDRQGKARREYNMHMTRDDSDRAG